MAVSSLALAPALAAPAVPPFWILKNILRRVVLALSSARDLALYGRQNSVRKRDFERQVRPQVTDNRSI